MKVSLKSTTKIVKLNGIPARIWEGKTDSGIKIHVFITRIAVGEGEDQVQFQEELQECALPSPEVEKAYPLSMIL